MTTTAATSATFTLDAPLNPDVLRVLLGYDPGAEPADHALTVTTLHEPLTPPRKRRRLTGKAYRAARRRYRRERRAWLRAGAPMYEVLTWLPRVKALDGDDTRTRFEVLPTLPERSRWWDLDARSAESNPGVVSLAPADTPVILDPGDAIEGWETVGHLSKGAPSPVAD